MVCMEVTTEKCNSSTFSSSILGDANSKKYLYCVFSYLSIVCVSKLHRWLWEGWRYDLFLARAPPPSSTSADTSSGCAAKGGRPTSATSTASPAIAQPCVTGGKSSPPRATSSHPPPLSLRMTCSTPAPRMTSWWPPGLTLFKGELLRKTGRLLTLSSLSETSCFKRLSVLSNSHKKA